MLLNATLFNGDPQFNYFVFFFTFQQVPSKKNNFNIMEFKKKMDKELRLSQ